MTIRLLIICCFFLTKVSFSQDKYLVFFTDKKDVESDYQNYFDNKALERRQKLNLAFDHYTDLPLNQNYVEALQIICDSIRYQFRWFNAVSCIINESDLKQIKSLPFVKEIYRFEVQQVQLCENKTKELTHGQNLLAKSQLNRFNGLKFHEQGIKGKGIRIAILDAGFPKVDELDEFAHIRNRDGIIATYDFIKNKPNAYRGMQHGTMVLSNIAGLYQDSIPLGLALDADFLLARTESLLKEGISDEENWLAAVEWADKNGADIINSSLGYTNRLYMRNDMDGQTSLVAKAANIAASKGILVINSAGNEGSNEWTTIGSPADADSVLAVGGINPWTNMHTMWSSFGPSSDKRIKPNVCAYGHAIVVGKTGIKEVTGTSFASPLTAGFAACAWQSDSTLSNMELFEMIEESSDLYPYYDYAHGYGVPQADYFLERVSTPDTSFFIDTTASEIRVFIREKHFSYSSLPMANYYSDDENNLYVKDINGKNINMDNEVFIHFKDGNLNSKASGIRDSESSYFYYHLENNRGYLDVYYVLGVEQLNVLNYIIKPVDSGKTIRFYYKGFIQEYRIP